MKLRRKKTPKESTIEIVSDPMIHVRRNGAKLILNSSCLPFWEKLQLEPLAGKKNCRWIFMDLDHPNNSDPNSLVNVHNIASVWRNSLFGDFQPLSLGNQSGIVNCAVSEKHPHEIFRDHVPLIGFLV